MSKWLLVCVTFCKAGILLCQRHHILCSLNLQVCGLEIQPNVDWKYSGQSCIYTKQAKAYFPVIILLITQISSLLSILLLYTSKVIGLWFNVQWKMCVDFMQMWCHFVWRSIVNIHRFRYFNWSRIWFTSAIVTKGQFHGFSWNQRQCGMGKVPGRQRVTHILRRDKNSISFAYL